MHIPKFQTYSVKHQSTGFEFYILSKGLNSGKPLLTPCPNSFVCICKSQEQKDFYFWLLFGLWKAKYFHQFLTGSVIPFIRLSDLKNEILTQAEKVSKQEKEYKSTVDKKSSSWKRRKEPSAKNLALINDLKKGNDLPAS